MYIKVKTENDFFFAEVSTPEEEGLENYVFHSIVEIENELFLIAEKKYGKELRHFKAFYLPK